MLSNRTTRRLFSLLSWIYTSSSVSVPFPYIGVLFKVLTVTRTKGTIGDPPTIVGGNPERVDWRIHNIFEDCNESLPNPHAIITLTSDVPANNAKHCLTLHEMQAILGIMVIRTIHRPFSSHPLHPVSHEQLTSSHPRLY